MNTKCCLIKDLLELYHDGVCSEETRREVEAHLKECGTCRAEYEKLIASDGVAEAVFDEGEAQQVAESYKNVKHRNRKKLVIAVVVSMLAAALICAAIVTGVRIISTIPVYPQPLKFVETEQELRAELEKAELELLIPDVSMLHSYFRGAGVELDGRTRRAKATGYIINGTSEERGYDWMVSALREWRNGQGTDIVVDRYDSVGEPPESEPEAGKRYTTAYQFTFKGYEYTVQGTVFSFDLSPEELESKREQLAADLLRTVNQMLGCTSSGDPAQ